MDWSAIQVATLMMPTNARNPRLEEALQKNNVIASILDS
jgi:hypothetical protein